MSLRLITNSLILLGFLFPFCQSTTGRQPATTQQAQELPDPPTGFSWHRIKSINAAFLKPVGWHYTKLKNKHGVAFRFSKEDSKSGEPFLTGLTVNVTQKVSEVSHAKPSLYAVHFMDNYTRGQRVVMEGKLDEIGKLKRLTFEVIKKISESKDDAMCRIRVVVIANDATDTLYTLIYGAPEDEWSNAWKIGKKMLGFFQLDDDV
jgi:hypothetical protein